MSPQFCAQKSAGEKCEDGALEWSCRYGHDDAETEKERVKRPYALEQPGCCADDQRSADGDVCRAPVRLRPVAEGTDPNRSERASEDQIGRASCRERV